MHKSFISVLTIFLVACHVGRVSSPEFMLWKMTGTTNDDIKMALLECGANNPFGDTNMFPYRSGTDVENYARVNQCMKNSGFEYSLSDFCSKESKQNECRLENLRQAHVRNKETRINSEFCRHKDYSKWKICQP